MKKAKVMFTAIAVLAVVGGALAFKAKDFNSFYTYNEDPQHPSCDVLVPLQSTITDTGGVLIPYTITPTTANPNAEFPCGQVLAKFTN